MYPTQKTKPRDRHRFGTDIEKSVNKHTPGRRAREQRYGK